LFAEGRYHYSKKKKNVTFHTTFIDEFDVAGLLATPHQPLKKIKNKIRSREKGYFPKFIRGKTLLLTKFPLVFSFPA
jgi:hypothetical protein